MASRFTKCRSYLVPHTSYLVFRTSYLVLRTLYFVFLIHKLLSQRRRGNHTGFLPAEPTVTVTRDPAVNPVADKAGYNDVNIEYGPGETQSFHHQESTGRMGIDVVALGQNK